LPLQKNETVYYVPLEEAPYKTFASELGNNINLIVKKQMKSAVFLPAKYSRFQQFHSL
jgi:hypothetical protein